MKKSTLASLFASVIFMQSPSVFASDVSSQFTIPDVYADTPVQRVASDVVAEWQRFTFLESAVSYADGQILVTDHVEGKLYAVNQGQVSTLISLRVSYLP